MSVIWWLAGGEWMDLSFRWVTVGIIRILQTFRIGVLVSEYLV
jgi:hypothetical protein